MAKIIISFTRDQVIKTPTVNPAVSKAERMSPFCKVKASITIDTTDKIILSVIVLKSQKECSALLLQTIFTSKLPQFFPRKNIF